MDDFTTHLAPFPRRLPSGLPVQSIGYARHKTSRVTYPFSTFNFSIILSGGGSYVFQGRRYRIEPPCVITQWPDEPMDYGPDHTSPYWEELFLIYPATAIDGLRARGLALERKPMWPVRRATPMREQLALLLRLLPDATEDGVPDRIDRACELLIVESRLGESRPPMGRDEALIRDIREHVRTHFLERHDFNALAHQHGLSPTTFRRYWERYVHTPPARYAMQLRMREACRLLVETNHTVAEIAHALNFEDPLYFSRRFSAAIGVPATTYRHRHRVHT